MNAIINQPFGLGDVIFEQTLIRSFGFDKILWPVEKQFVEGLNRAYEDIFFCDRNTINMDYERKDEYIIDNTVVLPLRFADSICKVDYSQCMASKYMLCGQDWHSWKNKALWKRDNVREALLYHKFGLPSEYNLINNTFGSNNIGKVNIHISNGLHNIYMKEIQSYSLFDWALIIENATNIYTVSTSIIYLLELLKLKAQEIKIFIRRPYEQNHKNYDYILQSHNYILE